MPTKPMAERYRIAVPDETLHELAAAAVAIDDLAEHTRKTAEAITARIDQVIHQLVSHLTLEQQWAFSKELFELDED
jgi:hypothetical protein